MKLIWKLAIPQICIVVCLGLISFVVINASFTSMRSQYVQNTAEDHIQSIKNWVTFSSQRAVGETSLFVGLPVVREAYEIALSGDIDDPYSPQSRQARELLREKLEPMLDGYGSIMGKQLQLHFHLPNGRSLVRLWRDKNATVNGVGVDISDDISVFRQTVMETNRTGEVTMGIESGIGGFSVRGVVPVVAPDGRHLGSAEVLQQFHPILDNLTDAFALYANADLLEYAADLQDRKKYPLQGNFVRIVGTDDPAIEALITTNLLEKGKHGSVYEEDSRYTLMAFPLNDFQGKQVGVIILALDTRSFSALAQAAAVILAFMLAGMIVAPTSMLLQRSRSLVTRPLNRIKVMIQDIAEDRADLTAQIPADQKDEIGELARWFNTLTTRLSDIMRERQAMFDRIHSESENFEAMAHWYSSLLDAVPFPVSAQDTNMRWTFVNAAMARFIGKTREEALGLPCGDLTNVCLCNTEDCAIVRARRGIGQTRFVHDGASFQINTGVLKGLRGETTGFIEVVQDITQLERLRVAAEAKNHAKSAFLAQISHEMRTPLNAVLGLSELMLEGGGLTEDNETYLDKVYNAGSTLLSIVNDILDISKIEAGKFELIEREYDVPGLINDAITQNILRIHSRPIRFTLDIRDDIPARLYGDELRVKQIMNNLLSNAFKYTEQGTVELSLSYEREGDDTVWVTLRVSDTGIGIRPEDLSRIFSDYTRFDEASERKIDGTGLGLSITKRLVEMMGGDIGIESEWGKGSVFTVRFRQHHVNDFVIGHDVAEHLRHFRYFTSKRRRGAQVNRVRIPYARVLVVDDNLTNLDIAQGLMKPYGMDIDCVTSGQAAVDAVREGKHLYSAIFMDHMMPGMDGIEATRIIREEIGSEYARTVPIIALTANAVVGNEALFISKGFNAFISKPIDIFRLDEVIRKWLWDKEKDSLLRDSREFADRREKRDRRVADRRSGSVPQSHTEAPEGVDWIRGLELFGDAESFRQVLRSFAIHTRPLLESLSEVSGQSLAQYAIVVHGIKSSSRGVCAESLGRLAESLESAAKDGNLGFVSLHNQDFLQAARKLVGDIERLLDETGKSGAKPQKDKPGDTELARLCAACSSYDMDGIDAVMREIEEYEYTDDDGLAEWLCDNIARLNYAQVVERIQHI